jgi:SRSO17 transposase
VQFRTKPQIALELIDRALGNGVRVAAWTFDELYGRDGKFLDGLEQRQQLFVGEVPMDFHGWVQKPKILRSRPKKRKTRGRAKEYPRLARYRRSCEVRNLVRYSPVFRERSWQRYRIKDTDKGPEVWEVKWAVFWRKGENGLPGRRHCLIVARNVLTAEVKYFVANRVPGEKGITLRWLLRVAFGRWSVERCFRVAKDELGMDHYQVRGWRCLYRHFYELLVLCQDTAAIRQAAQPGGGSLDDRASPQRREHLAIGRRPEARRALHTARERPEKATLLPAAQWASRKVPRQNENRPIDSDGHRRQPDQIMYNLTCSPMTYGISRLGLTSRRSAKVALPN